MDCKVLEVLVFIHQCICLSNGLVSGLPVMLQEFRRNCHLNHHFQQLVLDPSSVSGY